MPMESWKKKAVYGLVIVSAVSVAAIVLWIVFVDFVVDFWWFQSQELAAYFLMRVVYRYVVFIFFTAFFFGVFYFNFWTAARSVGVASSDAKDLVKLLHEGLHRFYLPLSLVMAVPIAWPLFTHWEEALMFLMGPASGTADPLFGKDISFYLFRLPVYEFIQREVLVMSVILIAVVSFMYWYEHRLLAARDDLLLRRARIHISSLALMIVLFLCWGLFLKRYELLYSTINLPIFFGPGYVEMRIILPLLWLAMLSLAATGISLVVAVNRRSGWKLPAVFGLLFVVTLVVLNADFLTDAIRRYVVAPNQIARERPYISANIHSTLAAYGLDRVETKDVRTGDKTEFDANDPAMLRRLQNIPVWDREMLGGVFEELQGIRTYYSFPTIDVDRYTVEGNYRQVYLGAREIQFAKLPQSAQNWINLHLQYTHGQGVVMIPAAQAGDEFMTWFVKDIPPRSDYGLVSDQTSIYFGQENKPYVIVPNDAGETELTAGDGEIIVHYGGQGGVAVNSIWRKLLLAIYFKERNIFFTTKTNERSQLLFRRNIIERITHITPFLKLDQDPYVVTTPERLYWIQDAYTISDRYPLAPPVEEGFNYIRNSVKIVVDAYSGRVTYYLFDTDDAMVMAYRRMYPGLFEPAEAMPDALKNHIRYPQDIFRTQIAIYATYHQENPERFYRQEDIWEFSKIAQGKELVPANPYFLTLDLIEPGKEEFLLFMPMSPFGRDNLRAIMIAGSDGENYGKIFAYRFPRDHQVYGPAQIQSLVNQDVIISEQFTLWDQEGSEVILGKMIIEPTEGSLLYIQPVYLQEEGRLKIPQLKRLIMAIDDAVVMAPSLEEAAVKLEAELARKSIRRDRRSPLPSVPDTDRPPGQGDPAGPASPPPGTTQTSPAGQPNRADPS